jgi:hypothetical protein
LDSAGPHAFEVFAFAPVNGAKGVEELVSADAKAVLAGKVKLAKELLGGGDALFDPIDFEEGIANGDFDAEGFLSLPEEGVVSGVEFGEGVGVLESEGLVAHIVL